MEFLKKFWGYIVAAFAVVGALFYYKNKAGNLEAAAELFDLEKEDVLLEKEQAKLDVQKDKELAKLEAERLEKLTPEEMVEYLKKI